MTPRQRLRRLGMGLATLAGRPRGFFTPYRYAAGVRAPEGYPEIGAAFARAWEAPERPGGAGPWSPRDVVAAMAEHADALAALDGPPPRPRWGQSWYPGLDGAAAYAIVRTSRPARIVEVGSGHSTRFLAEAVRAGGLATDIACIDPQPRAALGTLPVTWHREVLGERHLPMFDALGDGDLAFFDSSHLLWPGTDVDLMLNRILPRLAPGVLVHIHDVFLPDPYPPGWAWRGYTEQLGLAGWILGGAFATVWASRDARLRRVADIPDAVAALPLPPGAVESALWLRHL